MSSSLRALRRVLLGGAIAAVPGLVLAQESVTVVSGVIVTAARDPEDPPVVADARQRLSETPGGVAVVSAESLEDRYALTASDALANVAGVFSRPKWGEDVRLSIRGSGLGNNNHNRGLLLAQDGVPFNEADGYGDFQLMDMASARYIEVYKGGNALRFGGALLGGAVNIVTPTGETARAGQSVRIDAGSFDTWRGHAELARDFGDTDAFGSLTVVDADGYRQHSAERSTRAGFNVGRKFGEDGAVRLYVSGGDVNQQMPGSVSLNDALTNPRAAAPSTLPGALNYHRNMSSARGSLQADWRMGPATTFTGGVYVVWKSLDHPIFQVIDQESRNYSLFGRFDWTGEIAGLKADAFYGGWLRSGNMTNQRWLNIDSKHGALTSRSFDRAGAADLFAEGRLFVSDHLILVGGATWGEATRGTDIEVPVSLSAHATYDWLAPRIGLIWQADDGAQIYANVTRSIEPPNLGAFVQGNVPQPALKPQDAWTAEAGSRGRRGDFTWDVTVYRAQIDGELLTFNVDPGGGIPASTFNAQTTIHQGLEASLDWRIGQRWRLRQTYSWSDFRFDGDKVYGDRRLPIVPEHAWRGELRYTSPKGWFVAPGLDAQSKVYVDYLNNQTAPGFATVSFNAGYEPRDDLKLYLEVRNLTDRRYISNVNAVISGSPGATAYWPGEGRAVFAGLTKEF